MLTFSAILTIKYKTVPFITIKTFFLIIIHSMPIYQQSYKTPIVRIQNTIHWAVNHFNYLNREIKYIGIFNNIINVLKKKKYFNKNLLGQSLLEALKEPK